MAQAPSIPSSVTRMNQTFCGCTKLIGNCGREILEAILATATSDDVSIK